MPEILPYASPVTQPSADNLFNLKALAISHDILGVLGVYLVIAGLVVGDDPSVKLPLALMLVGSVAVLASGICIQTRRLRIFSLIVAALLCLMFPVGTILGICTLRVLSRPTADLLYRTSQANS